LLRVVVAEVDGIWCVVPDPRRRQKGRGASLHPTVSCLELAERRRAFGRALRRTEALSLTAVREYVVRQHEQIHPTESGTDADEHPMSDQR
jgi:predicted RNA-binding protein YlxR (DUF448 family)